MMKVDSKRSKTGIFLCGYREDFLTGFDSTQFLVDVNEIVILLVR